MTEQPQNYDGLVETRQQRRAATTSSCKTSVQETLCVAMADDSSSVEVELHGAESGLRATSYVPEVTPDLIARERYPACLVWTPIPLLSWLLPFVGHLGIADRSGVIHDFAGPYLVTVDHFAFGRPTRYVQLDPNKCMGEDWDVAVREGSAIYQHRMHNLCWDNCHSHVACCLNRMQYSGRRRWNMLLLGALMFFQGRFTGTRGVLLTFGPSVFVYTVLGIVISMAT